MMRYSLSLEAEQDIFKIVEYIVIDKPQFASVLLDEFGNTCIQLAEMPEMAEKVPEALREKTPILADCRRWPMKRFRKYLIFYKPEENGIYVLRVLSGRRELSTRFSQWGY